LKGMVGLVEPLSYSVIRNQQPRWVAFAKRIGNLMDFLVGLIT
jgi:hypothetical protein